MHFVRPRSLVFALGVLTTAACTPPLTLRASRVTAPRVVAVRADPPEAAPDDTVTLTALVVAPQGPVQDAPIDWVTCLAPRPATETTTVASVCLGDGAVADGGTIFAGAPDGHSTTQLTVPDEACRVVGPDVPPAGVDMQRARPPDPDVTGGFTLPVRVTLALGDTVDVSFARPRLRCTLPDLPADVARELAMQAQPNQNPSLAAVYYPALDGWSPLPSAASHGQAATPGGDIPLLAGWAEGQAEVYALIDPATGQVTTRTENLEVTWFTDGGQFEHDRTAPDASGVTSGNVLHVDADRHGVVDVWVVLRDDRSGVDFATLALSVP